MRWYFLNEKPGDVFIETGTDYGDTLLNAVDSMLFNKLISIDCCEEKQSLMRRKFGRYGTHIELYTGSSVDVLPKVIDPSRTTLFWLDAHFQGTEKDELYIPHGECPLMAELEIIVSQPWKVRPRVLIDDAEMYEDAFWDTAESRKFRKEDWCSLRDIAKVMKGWDLGIIKQMAIIHACPDRIIQCI